MSSLLNLTLHGVGPIPRPLESGEQRYWLPVARFERILDLVADRPDVRITFDDGNASDLTIALPRLLERRLTATFFVPAGRLGEPGRLDGPALRELDAAGMEIGSHGWAHRDWRTLDRDEVHWEMIEAPRTLARLTGRPVAQVAIPFGSYDRTVLRRLLGAGCSRAYTSDGGRSDATSWLQGRTSLRPDTSLAEVCDLLGSTPVSLRSRLRRSAAVLYKRHRGRLPVRPSPTR